MSSSSLCQVCNKKYDEDYTHTCSNEKCKKIVCVLCSHPCNDWDFGCCDSLWCLSHDENRCRKCGSCCPRCKGCSKDYPEIEECICKDCVSGTTHVSKIEGWNAYRTTGNRHPTD